ncbi:c-type cytochrome [Gemmata sp. G18]|uniref:C-type cytochrome n=1 Tax=Gemmata palustris TaxID=2822762 RepID=A0ABS5BL44_9BACT|nr:redoxin domain-containing protein [Gemmata palustris]MBP3954429.1 c-type cytochrome [Gemmata palustris]
MMRRLSFPLAAAAVVVVMVGIGWGLGTWRRQPISRAEQSAPSSALSASASANRGPVVYQVYCASCHGPDGHGDGSSAATLKPPPRDFAARPWRFEPTVDVIRRVTLDGIPGTGMASFRTLPTADLDAVVAHVHRLATSGPLVQRVPTEDERLLASVGFTDLKGTSPPPLVLTNSSGRTVKPSEYAGQLVLVHFWGTTCTHCIKEIPALERLERQYNGRLKVLHVCTDEDDPTTAQKFLDRVTPGATALTEATGLGLARYEVQALPTVWLIAPDGTAIGRSCGARDWTAEAQTKLISRWLPPVPKEEPMKLHRSRSWILQIHGYMFSQT